MFIKCPECCGEVTESSQLCPFCGHLLISSGGAGSEVNACDPSQNSAGGENAAPPPKKSGQHEASDDSANNPHAGPSCAEPVKLGLAIRLKSLMGNVAGFMFFFLLGPPFFNLVRPFIRYDYEGCLRDYLMMAPFIGIYLFETVFLSKAEIEACRRYEEERNGLEKFLIWITIFFAGTIVYIFTIAGIFILLFGRR